MAEYKLEDAIQPSETLYKITFTRTPSEDGQVIMPQKVYVFAEDIEHIFTKILSLAGTRFLDEVEIEKVTRRIRRIVEE